MPPRDDEGVIPLNCPGFSGRSKSRNQTCVGSGEIIAFREQWLPRYRGKRVGTAIAKIQPGWVIPFAESRVRRSRGLKLLLVEGDQFRAHAVKQEIEIANSDRSSAAANHD
jgi:hypothetical protein